MDGLLVPSQPLTANDLEIIGNDTEWSGFFTTDNNGEIEVCIAKVGGGDAERGARYEGSWEYWVISDLGGTDKWLLVHGNDLTTGTPQTHEMAAHILWDFLAHHNIEV